MKNQKGITLIALVITIIVLLILAGVTIAMLIGGDNGILNKATRAVSDTEKATAEEAIKMEVYNNIATNEGTFNLTTFTNITTNSDYTYNVEEWGENNTKTTKDVTVTGKDSKAIGTWSVDNKGAITKK